MAALLATILLLGFWGLLWLGAIWAGVDTRDGRDWSRRRSVTTRPGRSAD
jgi:hypothetical protein